MFSWFRKKEDSNNKEKAKTTNVEVMTNDNILLCIGNMRMLNANEMEIRNRGSKTLASIIYNTAVKIKGHKDDNSLFVLSGKIHGSSPDFWRVGDLKLLTNTEHRKSSRQTVNMHGEVRGVESRYKFILDCQILDISISGAKVRLKSILNVGNTFRIRFNYKGEDIELPCVVKRIIDMSSRRYVYGCQFINDGNQTQSDIARIVFDIEHDNIKKLKEW